MQETPSSDVLSLILETFLFSASATDILYELKRQKAIGSGSPPDREIYTCYIYATRPALVQN